MGVDDLGKIPPGKQEAAVASANLFIALRRKAVLEPVLAATDYKRWGPDVARELGFEEDVDYVDLSPRDFKEAWEKLKGEAEVWASK
jgi:hypothetical protein